LQGTGNLVWEVKMVSCKSYFYIYRWCIWWLYYCTMSKYDFM